MEPLSGDGLRIPLPWPNSAPRGNSSETGEGSVVKRTHHAKRAAGYIRLSAVCLLAPLVCLGGCRSERSSGSEAGAAATDAGPAPPPIDVGLVASRTALEPGRTVEIAVRFELPRPWHLYWKGRNDTGMPPAVVWDLPPGVKVGPLRWPAPERYVSPGDILDHVYFDELLLIAPLTAAENLPVGREVTLQAAVRWLGCAEICVPGRRSLELRLPVVARGVSAPSDEAALASFARTRARWPQPATAGAGGVSWSWRGSTIVLRAPGASRLAFFPYEECLELADPLHDAAAGGDELVLRLADGAEAEMDKSSAGLSGVLAVYGDNDRSAHFWTLSVTRPPRTGSQP
jgi:thiol:disulfide interchange protein DsbD